MGNDGGSIPRRADMVKTKPKAESVDKERIMYEKWNLCALTMEPLCKPVVACRLGRLYNKESVLNLLLDRTNGGSSELSEAFSHISSLKDVKELKLKESSSSGREGCKFVCPITGRELNGKAKFFYFVTCGCVLSSQALDEVKGTDGTCINCGITIKDEDDRIPINGTSEEVEVLKAKLKSSKKLKQKKAVKRKAEPEDGEGITAGPVKALSSSGEILALKRNKNINELYKQ